jgi:coenzyme F420-reducing hydrogenase delta subunit
MMTNNKPMTIYIFYCSNSLDASAARQALANKDNSQIKTVSLPCSGKVNLLYLLKAFETGADGVLLVTCKHGECQFLEGNLRAQKRSEAVDSMLEEIGFGSGRMKIIHQKQAGDVKYMMEALDELEKAIRNAV